MKSCTPVLISRSSPRLIESASQQISSIWAFEIFKIARSSMRIGQSSALNVEIHIVELVIVPREILELEIVEPPVLFAVIHERLPKSTSKENSSIRPSDVDKTTRSLAKIGQGTVLLEEVQKRFQ